MTEMKTEYVQARIFKLASGTLLKMQISLLGNCSRFSEKRPKADVMFPKSVEFTSHIQNLDPTSLQG